MRLGFEQLMHAFIQRIVSFGIVPPRKDLPSLPGGKQGQLAQNLLTQLYGLIKNRYMGRTFIEPDQRIRDLGVKLKFNPLQPLLENKRVVLVDDSIVRGTTTPKVIRLLRKSGAREVHMRVCAPPICYPCLHLSSMEQGFQGQW